MAGTMALTPFCLATSAVAGEVHAAEGDGGVEHARPCRPACLNDSAVPMAARLDEGEMP